ncbi:MAG: hypothetical protein R8M45_11985 [Ghiorsea sp.]
MKFSTITHASDSLAVWKTRLSEEEKIVFESDLDDYQWYVVTSDDDAILAVFQVIDVRKSYAKNLSIRFNPVIFSNDFIEKEMLDQIVEVVIFIFDSIVSICSGKMETIKFHTHDKMMGLIFSRLADIHKRVKNARKYGRWVEVTI